MTKNEKAKAIAIYHDVEASESFDDAADALFALLQKAQNDYPDQPRVLILDITGHRNSAGGFDNDMFTLQKEFITGFLVAYFTEVRMPLGTIRPPLQCNIIPDGRP